MIKCTLPFFVFILISSVSFCQNFEGLWKTTAGKVDNPCDAYYKLEKVNDTIRVKMSVPLFGIQQFVDMPVGNATINGVKISMPMFEGTLESDQLKGILDLFGNKSEVVFSRVNSFPALDKDVTPVKTLKPFWNFQTQGEVWSSPVIWGEYILIGSDDKNLYCISSSQGVEKWKVGTEGIIRCKPVISKNNVFFTSDDGIIRSVNLSTGNVNWKTSISPIYKRDYPHLTASSQWDYMQSSPLVSGGKIFVGSADSCLYALDENSGKVIWKFKTKGIIRSNPVVSNNKVFVGSWDSKLYALNVADGKLVWEYDTYGQIQSSPYIHNNKVIIGSRSANIYTVDLNSGKFIDDVKFWGSWVESTPVIKDEKLIIGSSDLRKITSFDPNNSTVLWQTRVNGYPWAIPVVDGENVFIGTITNNTEDDKRGYLYCINANSGKAISKIASEFSSAKELNGFYSTPVVTDKYLIVGSTDGNVYCYLKKEFLD